LRDGFWTKGNDAVQRFLCKECGYRFSEAKNIYGNYENNTERQICVLNRGAKNLEPAITKIAGETIPDTKSALFQFLWWQKKEGYSEGTIVTRLKLLRILIKRGGNIESSDSMKTVICEQKWCNKRKMNAADAYTAFLRMKGQTWNPPRYQTIRTFPFIPTEAEIDSLISGCGKKTSTFLLLLKETAMRSGEAHGLKWTDIDFEGKTVRITPEKGSNPRIFRLSEKLLAMLQALKSGGTNMIFCKDLRTQRKLFQKQRATLSRKLGNPRLSQIHFHTFRHWKATMEYHKTKDILYVMKFLGHRSITNTLMYTQLVDLGDDSYTCKVALDVKEASQLIEAGYDYVTEMEGKKLFRKRK